MTSTAEPTLSSTGIRSDPPTSGAADRGVTSLEVRSDSELLVKQMLGVYRVKNPGLQPLHGRARLLAARIGRVRFRHVRRELNKEADRLANLAMDEGLKTEDGR